MSLFSSWLALRRARLRRGRIGLIVLDADGVLIDYHEGYAMAWERAFGERPKVRDPHAYHPVDYWDVPCLTGSELQHLRRFGFTSELWRSMPAIAGAQEACQMLREAGCQLACVTALDARFEQERRANLENLGFGLRAVYAVGNAGLGNPKARHVVALAPKAFVDDFLPYLQRLPASIWRALIIGRPNLNPNMRETLVQPDSRHETLLEFARFWTRPQEISGMYYAGKATRTPAGPG